MLRVHQAFSPRCLAAGLRAAAALGRPVAALSTSGGDGLDKLMGTPGMTELKHIVDLAPVTHVRKTLASDPRRVMPYSEFVSLCSSFGLSESGADQLARDLHRVGVVYHFANSEHEQLRDILFLKPDEVTDAVYADLQLRSPSKRFVEEQAAIKASELEALQSALAPLQETKLALDRRAAAFAGRIAWGGLAGILGGGGTLFWMTYVYFSWDIVEPITYFIGAGLSTVGYAWWVATNSDYEYENVYDYFRRSKQRRLYNSDAFDEEAYNTLVDEVATCEQQLKTLEMTNYEPALLAAYLERKGLHHTV